jgi:predicted phosphoribosyltransferase
MWTEPIFKDRRDAGRKLARWLTEFAGRDDAVVLALPRGGVPVSSVQALQELSDQTGVRCIAAYTPEPFYGVGMWYRDFSQTSDEEVQELLAASRQTFAHAHSA